MVRATVPAKPVLGPVALFHPQPLKQSYGTPLRGCPSSNSILTFGGCEWCRGCTGLQCLTAAAFAAALTFGALEHLHRRGRPPLPHSQPPSTAAANGVTDNAPAIQRAASSGASFLYLPSSGSRNGVAQYRVAQSVTLKQARCRRGGCDHAEGAATGRADDSACVGLRGEAKRMPCVLTSCPPLGRCWWLAAAPRWLWTRASP